VRAALSPAPIVISGRDCLPSRAATEKWGPQAVISSSPVRCLEKNATAAPVVIRAAAQ
jgi:hypothetical protein